MDNDKGLGSMTDSASAVERLRVALEKGPTPGEWKAKQNEVWVGNRRICPHVTAGESMGMGPAIERERVNAVFIAACSPTTIRTLLDTLAEKESELKGAYELLHATEDKAVAKESEVQALREALQRITLYRAVNGDNWPAREALAALNPKEDQ